MNNDCPACNSYRFPTWKKALAVWPFKMRCANCRAVIRVKIPRWQNVLVQIVGQIVFWTALLLGIRHGSMGALAGGIIGAVIAILLAMIPGHGAELENLPGRRD